MRRVTSFSKESLSLTFLSFLKWKINLFSTMNVYLGPSSNELLSIFIYFCTNPFLYLFYRKGIKTNRKKKPYDISIRWFTDEVVWPCTWFRNWIWKLNRVLQKRTECQKWALAKGFSLTFLLVCLFSEFNVNVTIW